VGCLCGSGPILVHPRRYLMSIHGSCTSPLGTAFSRASLSRSSIGLIRSRPDKNAGVCHPHLK
jgi:hypothetical protein